MADSKVGGVRLSLWRATVGFRIVAAVLCLLLIFRWREIYARPWVALAVGGGILVITAAVVVFGLTGRAHRLDFAIADLIACGALTMLTLLAQHPHQFRGDMPTLTMVWAAGPVIAVGLVTGWFGGLLAGAIQFAISVVVRQGYDGRTLTNGLLLLLVGTVAGYVATRAYQAEQALAKAAARQAAYEERERLARSIHDGVLQVLGLVHRKGVKAGGEWAQLARAAAEQEASLRALITRQSIRPVETGERNLAADLVALQTARTTVSVPDSPVTLSAERANDVVDIVRAALNNVAQHAGAEARSWVLLEDLGEEIAVSVRDDGVGMAVGRVEQAHAQGRLGIARSIQGRTADLGGHVTITSSSGAGTEIDVVIPARTPTESPT